MPKVEWNTQQVGTKDDLKKCLNDLATSPWELTHIIPAGNSGEVYVVSKRDVKKEELIERGIEAARKLAKAAK